MSKKIKEMAAKGLNKNIFNIIKKEKITKKTKILILASGEGQMESLFLKYKIPTELYSVDYYSNFKFKNKIKFMSTDLNENNFSSTITKKFKVSEFDIIICIELIEHLNSQFDFLNNCKKMLKKNGKIFLSTPNTNWFCSRVDYLLTGYPTYFIDKPYLGGHISPVYKKILEHHLNKLNLKIVKTDYYGSFFQYIKSYKIFSFKSIIYIPTLTILFFLLNPLMLINRKNSYGADVTYQIKNN